MGGRFSKRNRSLSRRRSVASSGEGRTGSSHHHHNPVTAAISRLPSMTSTSNGPNIGAGGKSSAKKKYAFIPDNYHTLEECKLKRKLPHYFQEHTVVVITQLPLRSILRSTDYAGRIAKRGAVLGVFDAKYVPHALVKELVLAGLVA
uniref:Uncharacterized protein n=1 Tax=Quercus lobata TaxID=97700 RepID=A0A7N2LKT5_QUELO